MACLISMPSALGNFNILSVPTYDCPSVAANMGCAILFVTFDAALYGNLSTT